MTNKIFSERLHWQVVFIAIYYYFILHGHRIDNQDYQIIKNTGFKKTVLIKWQNFIHIIHCVPLLMNKIC